MHEEFIHVAQLTSRSTLVQDQESGESEMVITDNDIIEELPEIVELTETEQAITNVITAHRKSTERILNIYKLVPLEIAIYAGLILAVLNRGGVIDPKTFGILLATDVLAVSIYTIVKKLRRKIDFWRKRECHREVIEDYLYDHQHDAEIVSMLSSVGYSVEELHYRSRPLDS